MSRGFKPPLFVAVLALAVLMVLLAFLQYQWLGRITEADRDRQRTRLTHGVLEFTQDVDRELTRAYLLFQAEPAEHEEEMAERFAERYDRWLATSRFPRLFDSFYVFTAIPSIEAGAAPPKGEPRLLRFDPSARGLIPTAWPDAMRDWRTHLLPGDISETAPGGTVVIRRMAAPTWPQAPAIVAPMPLTMMLLGEAPIERRIPSHFSYSILAIDVNYVSGELFPELTRRHFSGGEPGLDFRVAVVSGDDGARVLYRSDPDFSPASGATVDAAADFFRVRAQDFASLAAEVRRFSAFAAAVHAPPGSTGAGGRSVTRLEARPLSIVVQSGPGGTLPAGTSANVPVFAQGAAGGPAGWKLVLKHSSGSLDAAVDATRRKNLLIGSSILGILGTSMALLVL
ncbi:MAG TPA: hypothetical protein VLD67_19700, partial [Vicinamibacterales bacterium]|nr:hypothetical protein [Vicinamibacterales bacterium]